MIRIFLPLICAALGFAAASCSQSEGPLAPSAEAPASDAASATSAAQSTAPAKRDSPAGTFTERRASTLIGMTVVATDGSRLGSVKDVIFDRQGRATHLVIAYDAQPQTTSGAPPNNGETAPAADRKLTAMPWDAAMASIKDGQLVLDNAQLQAAPSFTAAAWPNLDDPTWSESADAYWRTAVRAAIEAHPGAPIDSTSRQRARPSRTDQ